MIVFTAGARVAHFVFERVDLTMKCGQCVFVFLWRKAVVDFPPAAVAGRPEFRRVPNTGCGRRSRLWMMLVGHRLCVTTRGQERLLPRCAS